MKSNTKKRLIAFMLCMVLVLSSATSAFADEPQNTASQSQAEVVTEPVADEATGNEATEDEAAVNSSEQQQQEEQQPETESTPEGNLEDDISIQTTINGTTITMSGPYSSFPEGSNYEILASELNEEETKNVEVALKKKEDEKEKNTVLWVLAIIGAVAAVAGIAFAVYRFFAPDYLEDFEEDFDDDFDDYFEDEEE